MKKIIFSGIMALLMFSACDTSKQDTRNNEDHPDNDTSIDSMTMNQDDDEHGSFEITDESQIPSIDLDILEDSKSGWNLMINTGNFSFAPEKAGMDHVIGEGHAHLYINGAKITRLYGNRYHLTPEMLPSGNNEITVTLNTNDHNDYTYKGQVISDTESINIDGEISEGATLEPLTTIMENHAFNFDGLHSTTITLIPDKNEGDTEKNLEVIIDEDGYADDSVKGESFSMTLNRSTQDATWQVSDYKITNRTCYRSEETGPEVICP